jgi:polysaccharide deacetylase 2 family uncharacterized protein YibQ
MIHMDVNKSKNKLFLLLSFAVVLFTTNVQSEPTNTPTIAILIDDLGYKFKEDLRSLALPGPIAYAILPHGPHTAKVSAIAHQKGKDILLHQPMQAEVMDKNEFLGPGALTLNMTKEEFLKTLNINIKAVPNLIGINNHMGSLLTRHPGHMQWLMESIKNNGQFYVDSLTSDNSVAAKVAKESNVPYLTRDVFLDHKQDMKSIRQQFKQLVKIAKRKGSALGIGHPHITTIEVLNDELQNLSKYGVKLVSIKSLVKETTIGKKYAQRTSTASAGM